MTPYPPLVEALGFLVALAVFALLVWVLAPLCERWWPTGDDAEVYTLVRHDDGPEAA